jgi:hypothetical protein
MWAVMIRWALLGLLAVVGLLALWVRLAGDPVDMNIEWPNA